MRLQRLFAMGLMCMLLVACASQPKVAPLSGLQLKTKLLAAEQTAKTLNPEQRLLMYQGIYNAAPNDVMAQIAYGDALRQAGQVKEALKILPETLEDKPVRMDALVAYHKALVADGQAPKAVGSLLKWIPQVQESHVKQQKDIYLAAVNAARAALQPEPSKPNFHAGKFQVTAPLYNVLGVAYAAQNQQDLAIKAFELAQKYSLDPAERATIAHNLQLSRAVPVAKVKVEKR